MRMMTREQMKRILQLRTILEEFIKEDDFVDSISTILIPNMSSSPYISTDLKKFITDELQDGTIDIPAARFFNKNARKTVNSSIIMKNIGKYALYNTNKVAYDFNDVIATPEHGILIDPQQSHEVYCDREDNFLMYDGNFYNAIYSMGLKDFIDLFDSSEIEALNRIYNALIAEYSPIENVDEYEDITDTRTPSLTEEITQTESSTRTPSLTEAITQTESSTRTPSLTEAITQTESSTRTPDLTEVLTQTESNTRTPNLTEAVVHDTQDDEIPNVTETTTYNITESPKSTELTGDAGYNSAVTYENHRVVSGGSNIKNGSESVGQSGRKTIKRGGKDTTITNGTEDNYSSSKSQKVMNGNESNIDTLHSQKTSLGNEKNSSLLSSQKTSLGNEINAGNLGSKKISSGKEDLVHVKRRHGNIGVTMSQQLIEAELRLRKQNFYRLMFEMIANKLFSKIYR